MQENPTARSECLEIVPSNIESREESTWKEGLRTEERRQTNRSGDQNSDGTMQKWNLERELIMGGYRIKLLGM